MARPEKLQHGNQQTNKISSKKIREALDNCALEGIYPTQDTLDDLKQLDSGAMSPDDFIAFIKIKHQKN